MEEVEADHYEEGYDAETFSDIIVGYAEQGWTRKSVADMLGFNYFTFCKLVEELGIRGRFKHILACRKECRCGGPGKPKAYTDSQLLFWVYQYPLYSLFKAKSPIHINTVQKRFGGFRKARELAQQQFRKRRVYESEDWNTDHTGESYKAGGGDTVIDSVFGVCRSE
jgi:hypothetical protein